MCKLFIEHLDSLSRHISDPWHRPSQKQIAKDPATLVNYDTLIDLDKASSLVWRNYRLNGPELTDFEVHQINVKRLTGNIKQTPIGNVTAINSDILNICFKGYKFKVYPDPSEAEGEWHVHMELLNTNNLDPEIKTVLRSQIRKAFCRNWLTPQYQSSLVNISRN
jgi:hypothetical protein